MKANVYLFVIDKKTKLAAEVIVTTFNTKKEAREFLKLRIKKSQEFEFKWNWNVYNKEIKAESPYFAQYLRIK